VDRFTGNTDRHATACIEFYPGAGLWVVVSFADDEACARWSGPVRTAFRLLADTGFGGERSRGWGHAGEPEFIEGLLPGMILPEPEPPAPPAEGEEAVPPAPKTEPGYWLLSLYAPAAEDAIDWKRGDYTVVARAGRVDSPARSGDLKRHLNMITEGSVLHAGAPIRGAALDVAPENFPHPVYRAGFALAIPIQFEPRPAAAPAPVTP
jgi:CRISPR type III-A-associated RAMP protein Csm4